MNPKKKLRPLGKITLDMEPLLFEMVEGHEMQVHEIFAQIRAWAEVHYPDAIEEYMDGTNPTLKGVNYGPAKNK